MAKVGVRYLANLTYGQSLTKLCPRFWAGRASAVVTVVKVYLSTADTSRGRTV